MNIKLLVRIVPNCSKSLDLDLIISVPRFLRSPASFLPTALLLRLQPTLFFLLANSLPLPEKVSQLILLFEIFFCVVIFLPK
jgi:hypothetical protein